MARSDLASEPSVSTGSMKQWEVQSSTGKHFDVLDGIRGVAICMVVAYHTLYTNPESGAVSRALHGLFESGWMGVPVFFVLSGFLISYPFFRGRAGDAQFWYQSGYARRRIGKIVPPYYLSIVLFAAYYLLRFSDSEYLRTAWHWAVGLANFIPSSRAFNASYWSLLIEVHFYLLLPLLFWLSRGLKPRLTTALLFLTLFVVPLLARQLTWPEEAADRNRIGFLMARFPCQLDFFAWGILFSGLFVSLPVTRWDSRAWSRFGYVGLGLLIVTTGLWALGSQRFDIHDHPTRWSTEVFHLLPSVSAFLMLFFVLDPGCLGVRVLAHPALRLVGIVSYEWFLLHQPVVNFFQSIFGRSHGSLGLYLLKTVVPLALTFGLAVVVYRYFSLPLMNRIRGRKPKPLPVDATAGLQPNS